MGGRFVMKGVGGEGGGREVSDGGGRARDLVGGGGKMRRRTRFSWTSAAEGGAAHTPQALTTRAR